MSTHKSTDRRKVLIGLSGGIVGATQLPKAWTKPVVDSVMLPAHAATTDDSGTLPPEVTTTLAPASLFSGLFELNPAVNNTPIEDILSVIVPDAYAGSTVVSGQMCIDTSGAPTFTTKVELVGDGGSWFYSGSGTIGGAAAPLQAHSCNPNGGTSVSLTVTAVSAAGAAYVITASSGNVGAGGVLPEGSDCPGEPVC